MSLLSKAKLLNVMNQLGIEGAVNSVSYGYPELDTFVPMVGGMVGTMFDTRQQAYELQPSHSPQRGSSRLPILGHLMSQSSERILNLSNMINAKNFMYVLKTILYIVMIFKYSHLMAQAPINDPKYAMERNLQRPKPFEIQRFDSPIDVDPSGGYALSLNLFSIQNRSMANNLRITYRPGIRVSQEADGFGVGWGLDIPSVRRDVIITQDQGINRRPDINSYETGIYETELNDDDKYRDTYSYNLLNQAGKLVQMDTISVTGKKYMFKDDTQSDVKAYYDNNKNRFIIINGNGIIYVFGLPMIGISNNYMKYYYYTLATLPSIKEAPFSEWKITAILWPNYVDSGGDPLNPLDGSLSGNDGDWLGFSYEDGYSSTPGPDVKKYFYYVSPKSESAWNTMLFYYYPGTPYFQAWSNNGASLSGISEAQSLQEVTYIKKIISPTGYAVFSTETDPVSHISEWYDKSWDSYMASIEIIKNTFTQTLDASDQNGESKRRYTNIKYYYGLEDDQITDNMMVNIDLSYRDSSIFYERSFLKNISINHMPNSESTEYNMTYYDLNNTAQAPQFEANTSNLNRIGSWGWYNGHPRFGLTSGALGNCEVDARLNPNYGQFGNNVIQGCKKDGEVWNLKSISYPNGGRRMFFYESDIAAVPSFINSPDYASMLHQGGPRLVKQILHDGQNNYVYEYKYYSIGPNGDWLPDIGKVQISSLMKFAIDCLSSAHTSPVPSPYLFDLYVRREIMIQNEDFHISYSRIDRKNPDESVMSRTFNVQSYRTPGRGATGTVNDYRGEILTEDTIDKNNVVIGSIIYNYDDRIDNSKIVSTESNYCEIFHTTKRLSYERIIKNY